MNAIALTPLDLSLAALLVVILAGISFGMRLGLGRSLLIAAARTTVQLLLIGLVLRALFANERLVWLTLLSAVMLLVAGYEITRRQKRRMKGWWGYGVGTFSMFVSAFSVTVLALTIIIGPEPWYKPQYAIPLLGMMLGNAMTGVALSLDHLTGSVSRERSIIEGRLILGQTWLEAIGAIRRDAMRVGMIPTINAMAAAGLVHLPGMMTGQILAGTPPVEAVKYQILIMFLIAAITGFGTMLSVGLTSRRLFDSGQRLRLDRIKRVAE